ncbi:MAG: UPF0175 family protein [Candidatus Aenigmarchaeota archaeon]|nr:UPF0175 family protein [Candidatus Aenigmarchaeota archaeon]
MPVTITTRVEDKLAKKIDMVVRAEAMDRSTVVRRLLSRSVQEWFIDRALKDYEEGRITLWEASRRAGISLWEMVEEVKKRDIHVPYTIEDLKEDIGA